MEKELIKHGELKRHLKYEPSTGVFIWLVDASIRARKGMIAGCNDMNPSGKYYRRIRILGVKYGAHRLAWFYVHGAWPSEIDHINGNGLDNRLSNLREVNHTENSRNLKLNKRNTTGICGVSWYTAGKSWEAYIGIKGETKRLGYFGTLLDAVCARKNAEKFYGYHVNHGTDRPL